MHQISSICTSFWDLKTRGWTATARTGRLFDSFWCPRWRLLVQMPNSWTDLQWEPKNVDTFFKTDMELQKVGESNYFLLHLATLTLRIWFLPYIHQAIRNIFPLYIYIYICISMSNHCVMMSNHYCTLSSYISMMSGINYGSLESFADQFHEANVQLGRDAELQSLAESRDTKFPTTSSPKLSHFMWILWGHDGGSFTRKPPSSPTQLLRDFEGI